MLILALCRLLYAAAALPRNKKLFGSAPKDTWAGRLFRPDRVSMKTDKTAHKKPAPPAGGAGWRVWRSSAGPSFI